LAKRTKAQKAATAKLVAFNKKRKAKAAPKKKAPAKKSTNKATPRKQPMAAKKRFPRARKTGKGIASSLKTGVIGEVVKGIGAGSLITLVMNRVAPNSSLTPIASTGAAFLTGGLVGGAANLILSGGLSQMGGIFGGASAPVSEVSV
jgi:hypothetical protein